MLLKQCLQGFFLCNGFRTFPNFPENGKGCVTMSKGKSLYTTNNKPHTLSMPFIEVNSHTTKPSTDLHIQLAFTILKKQMIVEGLRERTQDDYIKWFTDFTNHAKVATLSEIKQEHIYSWLESMNVANSTKLIRLKALKAVLSRFYDQGYFRNRFWTSIKIRVDSRTKQHTTPQTLNILFGLLDLTNFFELRDAVAVLTMYKTGIRIATLVKLEEKHIDLDNQLLLLSGDITKNRQTLELPLPLQLTQLLRALIEENNRIREHKNMDNRLIFISKNGKSLIYEGKTNTIQKRLHIYSKRYGLKNLHPHAIRRAYAKDLYNRGAALPIISRALGHQDYKVTAKYLNISNEELVESLRKLENGF